MLLCLATTASLFCFDRLATTGSRRLLWWFAVLLALAFLAKAPMALLLIGVPVLVFLVVQRRLAQAFRWRVLACLGLALLASVTWYLVILAVVPGAWEMLKGEILLTLGDQDATQKSVAHYREIHYYVPQLLAKMALTALFLPLVVVRGRRTRWWRERPSERFLFVTVVSLFLALSLLPQKQRHYLMPLHPPAALLIACSVVPLAREGLAASRRWWRTLGAGSVALGLLLAGAGGLFLGWLLAEPLAVWSAAVAGTLALTVLAYRLAAARAPRLLTTCLLALLLGGAGLHYGGFDVLASKFEAGVTSPAELDVAYWRQFFDAHPLARRVLKAEEWPPRPEPSRTQPRKRAPEASAPSSTAKRP
jgi:4-amino-4-deoxy-L-arabinose transferase-like glycosyltransferase